MGQQRGNSEGSHKVKTVVVARLIWESRRSELSLDIVEKTSAYWVLRWWCAA